MSFATYADLKSQIALWLARDDLTAYIPDFISLFEAAAARKLRVRPMETITTLTPSSGTVALPADYLATRRVTWAGSFKVDLEYVHPSVLNAKYPLDQSGTPAAYTIEASSLTVRPSSDTDLEFVYFAKNAALSSQLNWLYENHFDAYLFGSLAEACLFNKNPQNAAIWGARRDAVFEEIKLQAFRENANLTIQLVSTPIASYVTSGDAPSGPDTTAPTITSSSSLSVDEGVAFSHSLTANESVTWTKTGGADAALFTLAGSTLSMIAKDYDTPVDADGNNTYIVQVTATDSASNATSQTITVTVAEVVADVTAPTITSSASVSLAENTALSHTLTADESVTWTKTGGADAALFAVAGNTLSMSAKDFEAPTDADANNAYVVQVTATDGSGNTASQTITVTVTDVDEVAPTITSSGTISQPENSTLFHTLTASEAVTWTKTGGADQALFTLAGSTLSLTAKDFETPSDADANNTYVVQVTATDGAGNATNQTITVTITDVSESGGAVDYTATFMNQGQY